MEQPFSSSPVSEEQAHFSSRSANNSTRATPISSRSQTQTPTPQGTGGDIIDSLQNLSLSPSQQAALTPTSPLDSHEAPPGAARRTPNKPGRGAGNEQQWNGLPGARLETSAQAQRVASPRTARANLGAGIRQTSGSLENHHGSRPTTGSTPLRKKASAASLDAGRASTPPRPLSRRTSSNLDRSPSGSVYRRVSRAGSIDEKPVLTPASVAKSHFQSELELHRQAAPSTTSPKTVVILHDACYGHRFARPRTSKNALSTIVERPERIHASIVGVSAAYVRLGGRHEGGQCPPRPEPDLLRPNQQPFRIRPTSRVLELSAPAVTSVHGTEWMHELRGMCDTAERNLALTGRELNRPDGDTQEGQATVAEKPKLHEGDLYLCSGSLAAFQGALGGVCEGVDAVFSKSEGDSGPKRAFVCIRPPGHHCSADYPSGFCWVNNVHVGIAHATMAHGLTHAAIIDFDLHHGDGSQAITWEHNARVARLPKNASASKKTSIGYFSLHDINSYPCEMGDDEKVRSASLCLENAHGQTVWNVHLQPWKNDLEFWDLYRERYSILIDKTRAYLRSQAQRISALPNHPVPKAAIFISAGFDASEWESPGMQRHKVNVPTEFYARFTADIVKLSEEEGLGVDGRVISVLEGGYSDRALSSGVWSHICGLAGTDNALNQIQAEHGLGYEMHRRMGALNLGQESNPKDQQLQPFDPAWWDIKRLEELEKIVYPAAPPPAPKKRGNQQIPQYAIPTESFTAKIVSSPKGYRNFSSGAYPFQAPAPAPAPTPPPVPLDVDWATATHELSKLLITSDRETRSCRPEELNAEASRKRRERHSIGLPVQQPATSHPEPVDAGPRRSQRDRRGKTPNYNLDSDDDDKLFSGASRRRTIATTGPTGLDHSPTSSVTGVQAEGENSARRLSTASNMTMSSINGGTGASTIPPDQTANSPTAAVSGMNRPGSAMTVASLHSNKSTGQIPLVKKTRFVSGTRAEPPSTTSRATKPTRPRPAPPIRSLTSPTPGAVTSGPTGPFSEATTAATMAAAAAAAAAKRADGSHVHVKPEKSHDGEDNTLDSLSKGMKKMSIKLHVPTREEHDARERKRADEHTVTNKPPPRKPVAPRTKRTVKKEVPLQLPTSATSVPPAAAEPSTGAAQGERTAIKHEPAEQQQQQQPPLYLSSSSTPTSRHQAHQDLDSEHPSLATSLQQVHAPDQPAQYHSASHDQPAPYTSQTTPLPTFSAGSDINQHATISSISPPGVPSHSQVPSTSTHSSPFSSPSFPAGPPSQGPLFQFAEPHPQPCPPTSKSTFQTTEFIPYTPEHGFPTMQQPQQQQSRQSAYSPPKPDLVWLPPNTSSSTQPLPTTSSSSPSAPLVSSGVPPFSSTTPPTAATPPPPPPQQQQHQQQQVHRFGQVSDLATPASLAPSQPQPTKETTATPSTGTNKARRREDLPVFTATSAIPFSDSGSGGA
ncbi:hypothetical protein L228DRAFT_78384 [Xylona heveae TC161]|uniref:Histone deacetylase domain-containing protein n=1 Tax=Xylona heveae (strain CBS 132557 / TC161) TaxID=1328760 RepID=A0A161TH31_XYLHT|nr:hypothetical protein L228DRAFT_78384 [Xylona heveae TC161]KZF25537.1 hypothetical protein L228DRAFT_78384 [Xylona heveae TC161]